MGDPFGIISRCLGVFGGGSEILVDSVRDRICMGEGQLHAKHDRFHKRNTSFSSFAAPNAPRQIPEIKSENEPGPNSDRFHERNN